MICIKKKLSNIIILIAVFLVLIPTLRDKKEEQNKDMLLKKYKESESNKKIDPGENLIIKINKIDLELPILNGAVHKNMLSSAATINHKTLKKGQNFSLAGHRNLRYGKNFNRLDELNVKDEVIIYNSNNKFVFEIYDKLYVKPDQVSVLDDSGETEITLVTCHPIGVSTHRLILKGKIKGSV